MAEKTKQPTVTIIDGVSGEELVFTAYDHHGVFQIDNKMVSVSKDDIMEALQSLNDQVQKYNAISNPKKKIAAKKKPKIEEMEKGEEVTKKPGKNEKK